MKIKDESWVIPGYTPVFEGGLDATDLIVGAGGEDVHRCAPLEDRQSFFVVPLRFPFVAFGAFEITLGVSNTRQI